MMNDFDSRRAADTIQETEHARTIIVYFNGLNGRIVKDGDKWCAITGEMPENYIAGFGDNQNAALNQWYQSFFNEKP